MLFPLAASVLVFGFVSASGGQAHDATSVTAIFGAVDVEEAESVRGMIRFHLGGVPGVVQAINWTTSGITIPSALISKVCGSVPEDQKFTYSINEHWSHAPEVASAQGAEECGERYTGRRWDPSAACSTRSGNPACQICKISTGYRCQAGHFDPSREAVGAAAYRFFNEHACELGDLSGMYGELEAIAASECFDHGAQCQTLAKQGACESGPPDMALYCQRSCDTCVRHESPAKRFVSLKSLTNSTAGMARMSVPFGTISSDSVDEEQAGLVCMAAGPPLSHEAGCGCLRHNGRRSFTGGTMQSLTRGAAEAFRLAGPGFRELRGRSVVVQCGSTFAGGQGRPLFCARLGGVDDSPMMREEIHI